MKRRGQNQSKRSQNPWMLAVSHKTRNPERRKTGFEGTEKYYCELVDNCFDGIWLVKFDPPVDCGLPPDSLAEAIREGACIVEANDSLARMYGFQESNQILGHYFKEWFPRTDPNMDFLRSFAENDFRIHNALTEEMDRQGNANTIENSMVGILEGRFLVGIWGVQRDVTVRRKMEEASDHSRKTEQTIGKISSLFLTTENLDQCIHEALSEAGTMLSASRAYLFQVTEDGTKADNTHEWVAPGVTPQIHNRQGLEGTSFPWGAEQFRQHRVISVADVGQLPEAERSFLERQDIISILVVSIYSGQSPIGFLGLDETKQQREWLPQEITFLRTVSEILARAIDRERTRQALLQSETKFQSFQFAVSDVIYRYDPANNHYDFISPSIESQTGYSVEEFSSNPREIMQRITNLEDWKEVQAKVQGQIAAGPPGKPFRMEYRLTRRDGIEIWVSDQRTLEFAEDGTLVRINGVARDVTELKRAEDKLEKYAKNLEEKNRELEAKNRELSETRAQLVQKEKLRALGQMASGTAHDFNNFLAIILGRTQLLRRKTDDLEIEKGLAIIERAAQDAASTVKRIQDFARIRKDQQFEWVKVDDLITDVIAMTRVKWKDQAEAAGVTIRLKVERDRRKLPPVTGDPSALREVLTNLVFNAVEAMPQGGEIVVKNWTDRESVFLSVIDTGVGMPEEVKRRIFDPFFTTKGVKNSGLGLSVAYGIIQRHEGEIWAESHAGKGTTIVVRLPVRKDLGKTASKKTESEKRLSPSSPAHILVIEDDADIRQLLFDILTSASYGVTLSPNGTEGVKVFDKDRFDLVITGLGMPEMPGWEVADAVKKMDPGLPVLLLSGWNADLDQERLGKSGIDQVISKPIEVDGLLEAVARNLKSRCSKPQLAAQIV
ncbi:MAG: ATP-binding protein [Candidatus Zixiibacteriota bacterium]